MLEVAVAPPKTMFYYILWLLPQTGSTVGAWCVTDQCLSLHSIRVRHLCLALFARKVRSWLAGQRDTGEAVGCSFKYMALVAVEF